MQQIKETLNIDKAFIDAAPPGLTITLDASARSGGHEPSVIAKSIGDLVQRMQDAQPPLVLLPLRYILVTANLGAAVNVWNRFLGLPEAGVSTQAVGKHISWGHDLESARSIIILTDAIAVAVVNGLSVAITSVIHELGHVHDDVARGFATGFPTCAPSPHLNDWLGICAHLAEMTWSEYAAESVAAPYMDAETLRELMANDPLHLATTHKQLRAQIQTHKQGQLDLASLWSAAVTDIGDLFANLGRAAARLPAAQNGECARADFVDATGEAAAWKEVVDLLFRELDALGTTAYSEWGADPFRRLRELIGSGFQAAGFFPFAVGSNLRVMLR
jgi:hypothetical protein